MNFDKVIRRYGMVASPGAARWPLLFEDAAGPDVSGCDGFEVDARQWTVTAPEQTVCHAQPDAVEAAGAGSGGGAPGATPAARDLFPHGLLARGRETGE